VNSREDSGFRRRLCEEFLAEAESDYAAHRWASCVEHAQLAVENAAKSVLACQDPVPRTHDPQPHLRSILSDVPDLPASVQEALQTLIRCCDRLGFREHVLASYGDERTHQTPRELFGTEEAKDALQTAQQALQSANLALAHFLKQ
jgi:HEPN domain-containing protein